LKKEPGCWWGEDKALKRSKSTGRYEEIFGRPEGSCLQNQNLTKVMLNGKRVLGDEKNPGAAKKNKKVIGSGGEVLTLLLSRGAEGRSPWEETTKKKSRNSTKNMMEDRFGVHVSLV